MKTFRSLLTLAGLALLAACQGDAVTPSATDSPARSGTEGFAARGELRTGYVLGPGGVPMEITFEVHHGRAIWEGDIDLGPAESIASTPEELERPDGPRYGVVIDGSSYRWPGGVVPYVIDPSLPNQSRVTNAIAHIEANTQQVDFVPRTTQADYIKIIPSTGCASSVGRVGGVQYIYLADGCSTGSTIHEFNHALGMWHEQSRCDRDGYVEILLQNVQSGKEHNFDKKCTSATDLFGYAEGSIMHYGPYAFSANNQPTIRSLRGLDHLMGQRSGLGTTDISTLDQLYPPPPAYSVSIDGPTMIFTEGTHTWTAVFTGNVGSHTTEWWIRRHTEPYWSTTSWEGLTAGDTLSMNFNACDPHFDLQARVYASSGNQIAEIFVENYSSGTYCP